MMSGTAQNLGLPSPLPVEMWACGKRRGGREERERSTVTVQDQCVNVCVGGRGRVRGALTKSVSRRGGRGSTPECCPRQTGG